MLTDSVSCKSSSYLLPKISRAGGHDLGAKATIRGCPALILLYISFFLLVFRKLFSETFLVCISVYLMHLAADVLLLAFSSSEYKRDFLVLFSDSFLLVFSCAMFAI